MSLGRRPDALDREGGGDLGVPVVEEVTDHQVRGVLGQGQPVPLVLLRREDQVHLAAGTEIELVEQHVGRGGHAGHRLQADVARRAPVAPDPVGLARPQGGAGVDAVGAVHAPLVDVVHPRDLEGDHRVGVGPQAGVEAEAEQHEEVAEPGRHVHVVARPAVGHHRLGRLAQRVEEVRHGAARDEVVRRGISRPRRLADGEGHP